MYENPELILDSTDIEGGKITWQSPSNIAIVKYWGKHGKQLPRNPSVSLTLTASHTQTQIEYAPKAIDNGQIDMNFEFHGEKNEAFQKKIQSFLEGMLPTFPFLKQLDLTIRSGNSFPHSAGIASSASAMSALALCLCSLEDKLFSTLGEADDYDKKASYIARLGSGSACRSIFPHVAAWGASPSLVGSSDDFAVEVTDVHDVFKKMHNDILIVSTDEKPVSSRAGHALMEGNPFAASRYQQANERFTRLLDVFAAGDLEAFGKIAEDEAMSLHALMMLSDPSYVLMRPGSLAIIEKVRQYRADTGHPVYFTLDAGPNIHLLYPEEIISDVRGFIGDALAEHCQEGYFIQDWVGEGPEEL